eukprot:762054-Prorocentrum_minimum.AAC.5
MQQCTKVSLPLTSGLGFGTIVSHRLCALSYLPQQNRGAQVVPPQGRLFDPAVYTLHEGNDASCVSSVDIFSPANSRAVFEGCAEGQQQGYSLRAQRGRRILVWPYSVVYGLPSTPAAAILWLTRPMLQGRDGASGCYAPSHFPRREALRPARQAAPRTFALGRRGAVRQGGTTPRAPSASEGGIRIQPSVVHFRDAAPGGDDQAPLLARA